MFKKIILIVTIFIVTGEIMIRIDEKFIFLSDTRIVKIATGVTTTPEFNLLNENKIDFSEKTLRIMVIGDSYIAGGGIELKDRFSQQLKLILKINNKIFDQIYVLDVSSPSSNSLDNSQTYFNYVDKFKPTFVILGYNLNDVEGNLEIQRNKVDMSNFNPAKTNSHVNESFTKKLYNLYKKSKFLDFILHKLHNELKAHGIIVPNSVFDLILKSYYQDKENWEKSKLLLKELAVDTKEKNIQLIVLKFPEINLLEYPELFVKPEKTISDFFKLLPFVKYVNGSELFNGGNSKDYILSKYDGHPNEKAHKKMATEIARFITVKAHGGNKGYKQ